MSEPTAAQKRAAMLFWNYYPDDINETHHIKAMVCFFQSLETESSSERTKEKKREYIWLQNQTVNEFHWLIHQRDAIDIAISWRWPIRYPTGLED